MLRSFPDPCCESGGGGECDVVAEMFELVEEVASAAVGVVVAGEVVDADALLDDEDPTGACVAPPMHRGWGSSTHGVTLRVIRSSIYATARLAVEPWLELTNNPFHE